MASTRSWVGSPSAICLEGVTHEESVNPSGGYHTLVPLVVRPVVDSFPILNSPIYALVPGLKGPSQTRG